MMRIDERGEMFKKELRNETSSDYILYRACEINNQYPPYTNNYSELYSILDTMSTAQNSINYMYSNNPMNDKPFGIERFVEGLYTEFELNCIIKEDFNWIESSNKRLICYIWKLLNYLVPETGTDQYILDINITDFSNLNTAKTIVKMNHISIDRVNKNDIIHFINRLSIGKPRKFKLLETIKYIATSSLSNQGIYKWLSADSNIKMPWVQKYLNTTMPGCIPEVIPGSSSAELEIVSFFDLLCTKNVDKFNLIAIKISKAWSQQKHREKNTNKKQYSIIMSNDIGGILDEISIKKNEHKNAIIETLIREAYEKLSKD